MTTDDTIRAVIAKYGRLQEPVEGLADTADLYEAGMTSHSSVTVMLGLEGAFDIEFPDHLQRKATFVTIESIRAAVEELAA